MYRESRGDTPTQPKKKQKKTNAPREGGGGGRRGGLLNEHPSPPPNSHLNRATHSHEPAMEIDKANANGNARSNPLGYYMHTVNVPSRARKKSLTPAPFLTCPGPSAARPHRLSCSSTPPHPLRPRSLPPPSPRTRPRTPRASSPSSPPTTTTTTTPPPPYPSRPDGPDVRPPSRRRSSATP